MTEDKKPNEPNPDMKKAIDSEMVRQAGDLGNYVLKAIPIVYSSFLIALIAAPRLQTGSVWDAISGNNFMLSTFGLLYCGIVFSIWWAARTHVLLANRVMKKAGLSEIVSKLEWPVARRIFQVDFIFTSSQSVVIALIVFLAINIALLTITAVDAG